MDLVKVSKVTAGMRTRVFRMLSDDADHYTTETAILEKLKIAYLCKLSFHFLGILTFVSTPVCPP